jgi:hypothetical protein
LIFVLAIVLYSLYTVFEGGGEEGAVQVTPNTLVF